MGDAEIADFSKEWRGRTSQMVRNAEGMDPPPYGRGTQPYSRQNAGRENMPLLYTLGAFQRKSEGIPQREAHFRVQIGVELRLGFAG